MKYADVLLDRGMIPQLAPYAGYLLDLAEDAGVIVRITSVYRSSQKQQGLYDRWLRGLHDYPVAPPGRSYHEYGRAMDVVTTPDVNDQLGRIWESWGGRWGTSRDPIHFQA